VYLDDERYPGMKEQFGIATMPGVVFSNSATNKNFVFDKEFNEENVGVFVKSYVDGSLKATIKSAPIPTGEAEEENDIFVVVGDSFKKEVME
jgi:hypothetical protein